MKFQVPQFIQTETKVVGPFTLKQFLWVAGGMAVIFFSFLVFPTPLFLVVAILAAVFFGALGFISIDGVPLFNYMVYLIGYMVNPRRYFFKKTEEGMLSTEEIKENFTPKRKGKGLILRQAPTEEEVKDKKIKKVEDDTARPQGVIDEIILSSPDEEKELISREKQEKALDSMRRG